MSNSVILSGISKLFSLIAASYNNSKINKLFLKIDEHLKSAAVSSSILKIFVGSDSEKVLEGSKIGHSAAKLFGFLKRFRMPIKKYIQSSHIVRLFEGAVVTSYKNPARMVGIFGAAFLISNISYGLIIGVLGLKQLLARLILLGIFLVLSLVRINVREMLKGSIFVQLLSDMFNYEN